LSVSSDIKNPKFAIERR